MANSGHCWVLDDLAIERIMKGRMSCWPADGGGGGWPGAGIVTGSSSPGF